MRDIGREELLQELAALQPVLARDGVLHMQLFGDKALDIKHGRIGLVATRKGVLEFAVKDATPAE